MKKLIIHIGTGKTGSTSIQQTLSHAVKSDANQKFCYPTLMNRYEHGFLAFSYLPFNRINRVIRSKYSESEEILRQELEAYRKELLCIISKHRCVFLSSEHFTTFEEPQIELLKNDLNRQGFSDIVILIYVREPTSFYLSHLQQHLKASKQVLNPETFIYKFRNIILSWEKLFPNQVLVRPFDKTLMKNNCVVHDTLVHIENHFDISINNNINILLKNESLSSESMVVLQKYRDILYHSFDNVYTKDTSLLINIFSDINDIEFQNHPELKPEVRNIILRNHRNDLDWLFKNYKIEFNIDLSNIDNLVSTGKRDFGLKDILSHIDDERIIKLLIKSLHKALSK